MRIIALIINLTFVDVYLWDICVFCFFVFWGFFSLFCFWLCLVLVEACGIFHCSMDSSLWCAGFSLFVVHGLLSSCGAWATECVGCAV